MLGYRLVRSVAVALAVYGVLGLCLAAALIVVGSSMFAELTMLQTSIDSQRTAVVQALRTASGAVHDTAGATADVSRSVNSARGAADQASMLANDSAGTFRDVGTSLAGLTIFGLQPLVGLGPEFSRSADQLQQLAISLGTTRDALAQNNADIQGVGGDLTRLQGQLDGLATSLNQPIVFGLGDRGLLPFQVVFYGLCGLLVTQSLLSLGASVVLFRLRVVAVV